MYANSSLLICIVMCLSILVPAHVQDLSARLRHELLAKLPILIIQVSQELSGMESWTGITSSTGQ